MLCQDCPRRDQCLSPCASLDDDLARFDYYQRELLMPPRKLEYLCEFLVDVFEKEIPPEIDMQAQVRVCMEYLSDGQKEVVDLVFRKDLSQAETAEKLKISRTSVLRRLNMALDKISRLIADSDNI